MNRDRSALAQILERIQMAEDFAGKNRERFDASKLNQEAAIRELEVIGEAARRVSASLRAASDDIPWRAMTGFKNVAVHQYDAIDLDRVWEIIVSELPHIRTQIRNVLSNLPK